MVGKSRPRKPWGGPRRQPQPFASLTFSQANALLSVTAALRLDWRNDWCASDSADLLQRPSWQSPATRGHPPFPRSTLDIRLRPRGSGLIYSLIKASPRGGLT
jgi:hypothetical protein